MRGSGNQLSQLCRHSASIVALCIAVNCSRRDAVATHQRWITRSPSWKSPQCSLGPHGERQPSHRQQFSQGQVGRSWSIGLVGKTCWRQRMPGARPQGDRLEHHGLDQLDGEFRVQRGINSHDEIAKPLARISSASFPCRLQVSPPVCIPELWQPTRDRPLSRLSTRRCAAA